MAAWVEDSALPMGMGNVTGRQHRTDDRGMIQMLHLDDAGQVVLADDVRPVGHLADPIGNSNRAVVQVELQPMHAVGVELELLHAGLMSIANLFEETLIDQRIAVDGLKVDRLDALGAIVIDRLFEQIELDHYLRAFVFGVLARSLAISSEESLSLLQTAIGQSDGHTFAEIYLLGAGDISLNTHNVPGHAKAQEFI